VANITLDEWEAVQVQFVPWEGDSAPAEARYLLMSADEKGVDLFDSAASDHNYRILFFPWHRIERIRKLSS
jgi:hypothetical protein